MSKGYQWLVKCSDEFGTYTDWVNFDPFFKVRIRDLECEIWGLDQEGMFLKTREIMLGQGNYADSDEQEAKAVR